MTLSTRSIRTRLGGYWLHRSLRIGLVLGVLVAAVLTVAVVDVGAAPQAMFSRRDVINAPQVEFARLADVDGDGDLDFLAVEPDTENVTWWENLSDGSAFTEHVITSASNGVRVVAPGDVDNDGDVDLLTLAPGRGRIGLWLNDGNGAFAEHRGYNALVRNASYIEAADVSGDGFADFFVILETTNRIDWYENTANASAPDFERRAVTNRAAQSGSVRRLDAGDVDGDGLIDFATANNESGRMNWWRHTIDPQGEHAFERQHATGYREQDVVEVSLADVDGDGDTDVFALRNTDPWRVNMWLQTPEGLVRDSQPIAVAPAGKPWRSIDAGDVNRDGAVDFLTSEEGGRLCWYLNPLAAPTPSVPAPSVTSTSVPTVIATATHTQVAGPSATSTTVYDTPSPTMDATRTPSPSASHTSTSSYPVTPSMTPTTTPSADTASVFLPRLYRD